MIKIDDTELIETIKGIEQLIFQQKEYNDNLKNEISILKLSQENNLLEMQKLKDTIITLQSQSIHESRSLIDSIKSLFTTNKPSKLKETIVKE